MKIFTYIRPKAKEFFYNTIQEAFQNPEITSFSDFRGLADLWAGNFLYDVKYDKPNEAFENEVDDILPRCRTLRAMSREQAYLQARRYWNGIEEIFSRTHYDYAVILPVDCYTLDIIDRVAKRYGTHVIAFIGSIFEGHSKITIRGEYTSVGRNVSDDEVAGYVEKMTQVQYLTPSETKNVKRKHDYIYKFYFRRKLIETVYYPLLKLRDRDPWNYHYTMYYLKGKPFRLFYNRKFDNYFKRLSDIKIDPKNMVYLPMHLIPEATTDYWCPNVEECNYRKFIVDTVKRADPEITFIIKEHPAMYGRRELSFYDELNSMQNVILLHPMDRSNKLLEEIETVVVDNGTVGVEALMRHKRVLTISDNYYHRFHPNAIVVERITKEAMKMPLQEYDNIAFLRPILEGVFPARFINSRNGIAKSDSHAVAEGIRMYLRHNKLNEE